MQTIDGAKVLYYTDKGDYGVVVNADGSGADSVFYLAVCKYSNDNAYYLFLCGENFEVITDDMCESAELCFEIARNRKDGIVWHRYT